MSLIGIVFLVNTIVFPLNGRLLVVDDSNVGGGVVIISSLSMVRREANRLTASSDSLSPAKARRDWIITGPMPLTPSSSPLPISSGNGVSDVF